MTNSKVALIDGDIIVYRIAYEKTPEKAPSGASSTFSSQNVEAVKEERTWEEVREAVDAFIKNVMDETGCSHYIGFLSDRRKNTIRYDLATIREYKGNRKDREIPPFFDEIKAYLQSEYHFHIEEKYEADDCLATCQTKYLTSQDYTPVMCSIDKDLQQVPGIHYNWNTNDYVVVSVSEAIEKLWTQVLTGDSTDNIQGIPKVGPKNAEKMLTPWSQAQYPSVVLTQYINKMGLRAGVSAFAENFALVHLVRDLELDVEPILWSSTIVDPEDEDEFL